MWKKKALAVGDGEDDDGDWSRDDSKSKKDGSSPSSVLGKKVPKRAAASVGAPLDSSAPAKPTPPAESLAVVQAQRSFAEGIISAAEFEQIVERDNEFRAEEAKDAEEALPDRSEGSAAQPAGNSAKGGATAATNFKAKQDAVSASTKTLGPPRRRSASVGSSIASVSTPGVPWLAAKDADSEMNASGQAGTIGHRSIEPVLDDGADLDFSGSPAHNARLSTSTPTKNDSIGGDSKKLSGGTWSRSRTRSGSVGRSPWSLGSRVSNTGATAGRSPSNTVSGYWKDRVTASVLQMLGGDSERHAWVIKATAADPPGLPKPKHVRRLVLALWDGSLAPDALWHALASRPWQRSHTVASISSSGSSSEAGAARFPSTASFVSGTAAPASATATLASKTGGPPIGLPACVTMKVLAVILKVLQQGPPQARCAATSLANNATDRTDGAHVTTKHSVPPLSALLEAIASHWDPNGSAAVKTGLATAVMPQLLSSKGPSQAPGNRVASNVTTKSSPRGWGGASAAAAASLGVLRLLSRSSGNRSRHNTGSWSADDDDATIDDRNNGPTLSRSGGSRNGSNTNISGEWRSRHNTGSWAAEEDEIIVKEDRDDEEEEVDSELKNLDSIDLPKSEDGRWNWPRTRSPPLSLASDASSSALPNRDATQSELLEALNAEAPANFGPNTYFEEEEDDTSAFEVGDEIRQMVAEIPPWDRPPVQERLSASTRETTTLNQGIAATEVESAPQLLGTLGRPALVLKAVAAFARAIQARAAIHGAFALPWEAVLTKAEESFNGPGHNARSRSQSRSQSRAPSFKDITEKRDDKDGFMAQVAGLLSDVDIDQHSSSSFDHSASMQEEVASLRRKHPDNLECHYTPEVDKDMVSTGAITGDADSEVPLAMLCDMIALQRLWIDALNHTLAASTTTTTTTTSHADASATATSNTTSKTNVSHKGVSIAGRKYSRTVSAPLSSSSQLNYDESTTSPTQASQRPISPATAGAADLYTSSAGAGVSTETPGTLSDAAAAADALDQCLIIMLEEAYVLAVATLNALASALQQRRRKLESQKSLEAPSSSATAPGSCAEVSSSLAMNGATVLKEKELAFVSPSTSTESFPMTPSTSAESLAADTSSIGPTSDSNDHITVQAPTMDLDGCYNAFFALLPALRTAVEETAQRPHVRLMLGAWHPYLPHGGNDHEQNSRQDQQRCDRRNNAVLDHHTGHLAWNPRSKPISSAMPSLSCSLSGISTPVPEHGTSFDASTNLEPPSPIRRPSGLSQSISRRPSLSRMPLPPSPFKAIALTSDHVFVPSHDLMVASHDPRHHRPLRAASFRINTDSELTRSPPVLATCEAVSAKASSNSPFAAPPVTSSESSPSLGGLNLWSFDGLTGDNIGADFGNLNDQNGTATATNSSFIRSNKEHGSSNLETQVPYDMIGMKDGSEVETKVLLRPPSFRKERPTALLRPPSFNIGTPVTVTSSTATVDSANEPATSLSSITSSSEAAHPPTSLFNMLSVGSNENVSDDSDASVEELTVSDFNDVPIVESAGVAALPATAVALEPPALQEPPLGMSWAPDGVLAAQSWRTEAMDMDGRNALGKCLGAFREWRLDLLTGNAGDNNSNNDISGKQHDRLRVSHAIGRGGCASVYLAHFALPWTGRTATSTPSSTTPTGEMSGAEGVLKDSASGHILGTSIEDDKTAAAVDRKAKPPKQWIAVALKKLEIPAGVPQSQLSRSILDFHAEASILHRLRFTPSGTTKDLLPLPGGGVRHPSVCALVGTLEQPLAVALENCTNGNLMTNLADRPDMLAWHHAGKRVALQVAQGMAWLHSQTPEPLLHRDLKSLNVLLDHEWNAKVSDFGLSRFASGPSSSRQLLTPMCGTYHWMAPEVMMAPPPSAPASASGVAVAEPVYGPPADVYSFAIVCWELATQQVPYDGWAAPQVVVSVAHRGERLPLPLPRVSPSGASSSLPVNDCDVASTVATTNASGSGPVVVDNSGTTTAEEVVTSGCPLEFLQLIEACWAQDPSDRPTFVDIERAIAKMPL